jgi:transposase
LSDLVWIDKDKTIGQLIVRLERLEARVFELEKENAVLWERLSIYEGPKNSRNSSVPPSKDENRPKRNQSQRKRTGRKPGGQPGHKDNTLNMTAAPDDIVELRPENCRDCGSSLKETPSVMDKKCQRVDIPPFKAFWTEYRTYARECDCGRTTEVDFPEGVDSPLGYGDNIEGLIEYYHARQYLPFKRMREMIGDVFNIASARAAYITCWPVSPIGSRPFTR